MWSHLFIMEDASKCRQLSNFSLFSRFTHVLINFTQNPFRNAQINTICFFYSQKSHENLNAGSIPGKCSGRIYTRNCSKEISLVALTITRILICVYMFSHAFSHILDIEFTHGVLHSNRKVTLIFIEKIFKPLNFFKFRSTENYRVLLCVGMFHVNEREQRE